MRDIGKNIKTLRQQKNMTQDELAEALFVTRQTVSNYETGRSRPDVEMLLKIAEVLGSDANTVLYGPEIPQSKKDAYWKTGLYLGLAAVMGIGLLLLTASLRRLNAVYLDRSWALTLVSGWLVPAWKVLAGFAVMQLLHAVSGVNRLKKPAANYVRWGTVAVIALYAVLILPVSVYLIRCAIEVALLRNGGGEFSYSSSFSFVPLWDRAGMIALAGVAQYTQGFWMYLVQAVKAAWPFIAGALLWLGGKEKNSC